MRIWPITLSITKTERHAVSNRPKLPSSYRVRSEIGLDGNYIVAVIKGRKNRFRYTRQFEKFVRNNKLMKLPLKPIERYIIKQLEQSPH